MGCFKVKKSDGELRWKSIHEAPVGIIERDFKKMYGRKPTSDEMTTQNWKQTRNEPDWITFYNSQTGEKIDIYEYRKLWDVHIKSSLSYPIETKQNIPKSQALSFTKQYMRNN